MAINLTEKVREWGCSFVNLPGLTVNLHVYRLGREGVGEGCLGEGDVALQLAATGQHVAFGYLGVGQGHLAAGGVVA